MFRRAAQMVGGPESTQSDQGERGVTFRDSEASTGHEISQVAMFSSVPKRKGPAAIAPDEVAADVVEMEEAQPVSGDMLQASQTPSEDPVRLYLKEIGKV